jgi:hypothetical protein
MKKTVGLLLSAAVALALGSTAFARDQETAQAVSQVIEQEVATQAAAPAKAEQARRAEPEAAKTPPQMRTELIKLNYAEAGMIFSLLRAYSTQPWGRVNLTGGNEKDKTIVITDTPEIVDKMLALVREFDVKPTELQFTVQIIQGTETAEPGADSLKDDPILRDLRSVLKYKNYSLLDGTILRVIDGREAEAKVGPKGEYSIRITPNYTKDGSSETMQVRIELRKPEWIPSAPKTEKGVEPVSLVRFNNDLISTTLTLKAGEKTVVGVSKSDGDKGLILILSGKPIK